MNKTLLIHLVLLDTCVFALGQTKPEINVIYGEEHIFTVETPQNWINDKKAAESIGLVSFFYSKDDKDKAKKSYFYAMGYDKDEHNSDLATFMAGDLKTFKKKYPDLTYEEIKVGVTGGVIDGRMLSFDNLSDRYREEVIYMETEYSILVFSFSTFTKEDYLNYQPVFDAFTSSFKYRGNDPKPYLEWLKSRN